jgi:hypothetical protein
MAHDDRVGLVLMLVLQSVLVSRRQWFVDINIYSTHCSLSGSRVTHVRDILSPYVCEGFEIKHLQMIEILKSGGRVPVCL